MFGGLYPTYQNYSVKDSFLKANYRVVNELDKNCRLLLFKLL